MKTTPISAVDAIEEISSFIIHFKYPKEMHSGGYYFVAIRDKYAHSKVNAVSYYVDTTGNIETVVEQHYLQHELNDLSRDASSAAAIMAHHIKDIRELPEQVFTALTDLATNYLGGHYNA